MSRLSRSLPAIAALAGASVLHAAAPDPALLGCWRAAKIVLHSPDGTTAEDTTGRCTLQFTEDQFASVCKTSSNGVATTTYRYRVVRPQVYAATMAGSTFKTEMVGTTREYEYRVQRGRLRTVTVPPPMVSAAAATSSRVETDADKVACP
ncbi:MAG: hypothetical protein LWW96_04480 [Acidovorax sp.]|uniref:hypothetical protein n=1 Tax=Acidovorax sp. TaxID=1872122 RepID=UPI0025BA1275|nr:hypothetical protein [Acidovorax sp.]MCE1191393.1 hypothetical protein [Acidovorax sp.]